MPFPTALTNAIDNETPIIAAHLNNLEAKVGADASSVAASLDYKVKNTASIDPGHKHSKVWTADGQTEVVIPPGTSGREYVATPITVSAGEHNKESNKTGFLNRGLVHYLKVKVTNSPLNASITLANEIKADFILHAVSIGRHPAGQHSTATISGTASATDLATLLTLTGVLYAWYESHNIDMIAVTPSYHSETGAGHGLIYAAPPATLIQASTQLNDIKAKYNLHEAETVGHDDIGTVSGREISSPDVGVISGDYDIEMFARDTFLEADLLYRATEIDPAADYEDWLPWFAKDADGTDELHVRLTKLDHAAAGVYEITIKAEQFA